MLNDTSLSPAEIRRYARHLILPEIGSSGQKKLKQASALLVGGPAALYLAAAGIGRLGIVDFDVVDKLPAGPLRTK